MTMQTRMTSSYPVMWLRWVRQQVAVAVRFELTATNPTWGPHLTGLPLTCGSEGTLDVNLLRTLIRSHPGKSDDPEHFAHIADSVMADPRIHIAEPDLTTMVAWHLARCATAAALRASGTQQEGEPLEDHECFHPEQVAVALVGSGLIAGSWTLLEIQQKYDSLQYQGQQQRSPSVSRPVTGNTDETQLPLPLFMSESLRLS